MRERATGGAAGTTTVARRALPWLLVLYGATSLLHFAHNAAYVADYPNLPAWITSGTIYLVWCAITAIGLAGYWLLRRRHPVGGLCLLAVYAALGLDGLLHYGRAPMSAHTLGMNVTIWSEVLAASLVLGVVVWIASSGRLREA